MRGHHIKYIHFLAVNDDDVLASHSSVLLVRMCGVTPPRCLIEPIFDAMFDAIRNSPVRIPLILTRARLDLSCC